MSKEKVDNYLYLYERATKTTTRLTGMPSGGGSDRNALLANLADSAGKANEWLSLVKEKNNLISDFINSAPLSELRRSILIYRYICRYGWKPLLFRLQEDGKISERKMYYEHQRALEDCAAWVNKTGKYKKEVLDI